jgi:ATP-dependent RNA circularization protein (DNA/RNA ligase family)
MHLEINKLIESDYDSISRVGWFLYDIQDRNDGLTQEELVHIVGLLGFKDLDAEMEKEIDDAYDREYEDGRQECCCRC